MLREPDIFDGWADIAPAYDSPAPVVGGLAPGRQFRRLLIVHHGDRRVAALEPLLAGIGYEASAAATAAEALAAMARGAVPDVLVNTDQGAPSRQGGGFVRDCLARWPALRALTVTFLPFPRALEPQGREALLAAPFDAAQLARALAALGPGGG